MLFVAEQLREVMASLGFRTVDEMVGHPECLRQIEVPGNRKDVYKRQLWMWARICCLSARSRMPST